MLLADAGCHNVPRRIVDTARLLWRKLPIREADESRVVCDRMLSISHLIVGASMYPKPVRCPISLALTKSIALHDIHHRSTALLTNITPSVARSNRQARTDVTRGSAWTVASYHCVSIVIEASVYLRHLRL